MLESAAIKDRSEERDSQAGFSGVQEFLTLLARAVQTYHTYPATSPLCDEAVSRAHAALVSLLNHDQLEFMVTQDRVYVGHEPIDASQMVQWELIRRLYRSNVAELAIDREATSRDLTRFCDELAARTVIGNEVETLAAALDRHGIDKIQVTVVEKMEVLDAGYPEETHTRHIQHEQEIRQQARAEGEVAGHLYPMDKAWVRLDPGCELEEVSLADLAILFEDPYNLAETLGRLSEGLEDSAPDSDVLLTEKFGEISRIFASLEPQVAGRMFQNLAQAVLKLEPEKRRSLLEKTVLPGLLEGKVDGDVLHHLPDVELAESLGLLLDLQVAAPEMLELAFDRLDLPEERQSAVVGLIEKDRGTGSARPTRTSATGDPTAQLLDRDADEEVGLRVDHSGRKDFREYAALNLSVDQDAERALDLVRTGIAQNNGLNEQILCLWHLLGLEPNPDRAETMLARVRQLLDALIARDDWLETATWVSRFRELFTGLISDRPEISDLGLQALSDICSADLLLRVAAMTDDADRESEAEAVVAAFGQTLVHGFTVFIGEEKSRHRRSAMVRLLCKHARQIGPAVAAKLEVQDDWRVTRNLVAVLGYAGPGYETVLTAHLQSEEERVVREVFQSLARCASPEAAALVVGELESADPRRREIAELTLWKFPGTVSRRQIKSVLSRGDFLSRYPACSRRLLQRAARHSVDEFQSILEALRPLRYRFWSPGLMRLGRAANILLKSGR